MIQPINRGKHRPPGVDPRRRKLASRVENNRLGTLILSTRKSASKRLTRYSTGSFRASRITTRKTGNLTPTNLRIR